MDNATTIEVTSEEREWLLRLRDAARQGREDFARDLENFKANAGNEEHSVVPEEAEPNYVDSIRYDYDRSEDAEFFARIGGYTWALNEYLDSQR